LKHYDFLKKIAEGKSVQLICHSYSFVLKDKAQNHKKMLDDAEEQFRFREEAKDLVS
jgi:hypothetical protein